MAFFFREEEAQKYLAARGDGEVNDYEIYDTALTAAQSELKDSLEGARSRGQALEQVYIDYYEKLIASLHKGEGVAPQQCGTEGEMPDETAS